MNTLQQVIKQRQDEFEEKVNEVRRETHWGDETDSPNHDFGYKTQRKIKSLSGKEITELFTVTDWAKVSSHNQETVVAILEAVKDWGKNNTQLLFREHTNEFIPLPEFISYIDSTLQDIKKQNNE